MRRSCCTRRVGVGLLIGLAVWWFHVTNFVPWEFLPFGSFWWTEGLGRGAVVNTAYRDDVRKRLKSPDPDERRLGVIGLLSGDYHPGETDVATAIKMLADDPSPDVRTTLASRLASWANFHSTGQFDVPVVRALGRAVCGDTSGEVRYLVACELDDLMASLRRLRPAPLYLAAAETAWEYAEAGLADPDVDVGDHCWSVLVQTADDLGRVAPEMPPSLAGEG